MANEKLIEVLAKQALPSYTPRELELISMGVRIGAHNAKEINMRPEEWYAEREAKKPTQERIDATTEWLKRESGLGAALERIKKMKTYDEVETEVLERYINALANNPREAQQTIDLLKQLIDQYYRLHPKKSFVESDNAKIEAKAREFYAKDLYIRDIDSLKVSTRVALEKCGIHTLFHLITRSKESLLRERGIGRSVILDVEAWLEQNRPGGFKYELRTP